MLRIAALSVAYGGLHALEGVSLEVAQGEFVTIVGPNGAGKTTLLKAVGGGVAPAAGRVEYRGRDIGALPSYARARLGIAHVPEGRKVFASLGVLENLEMGSYRRDARRRRAEGLDTVFTLFPILRERRSQLAGSLSGGEQQMLAIGRGIMAQPDLLLLDEPSQGLGPRIVESIFDAIAAIRRSRPITILLVEQRVVEALELCDRGYVLETGRVALSGDRETLLADPRVQRAYLGV
ncbi:MAG TPA: ABC transporter ATP-binding protein [Methylomirabilota bacterium]|jgi:branched-chain amino acid transport system ATP-binding protein|nr:ABC transporter ATP-binding protein [Methylomirabilota bacterium]